jgi:DNA-binding response OmpR family regulator
MGAKNILQAGDSGGARLSRELESLQRILVVDGEPDIRQLTTEALIQSGYEVIAAADAATAWAELNDDIYYDLVITENTMTKQTGIELLKKLRAARMILPVIMTTGTLPVQKFAASPWLQPHATLVKPFAVEELLGTVKKVLRVADSPHGQIAPPPELRRQLSAGDLQ